MLANKIGAIEDFVRRESGAGHVSIKLIGRLGGGAIQENWALDMHLDGRTVAAVLRADAPSGIAESWGKVEEFALLKAARAAGAAVIAFGSFLNAVIKFLIVAFAVFLLVKQVNNLRRLIERKEAEAPPSPPSPEIVLLGEIRDLLRKQAGG